MGSGQAAEPLVCRTPHVERGFWPVSGLAGAA
jgi:hypothetical protein